MANNVTLPKRTTIEGQPHKLAYITPQEGDLLKRMGGSGQMHRGVPAYPAGNIGGASSQAGDSDVGGGGFSGGGGGGRERAMESKSTRSTSSVSNGGGGLDVSKAVQLAQQEKAAQAALNQAIMADIAADLAQQPAQQNVDAISGLAGELGLTTPQVETAMARAMRGANLANTMQMFSPLSWIGKGLGLLEDPRIAARRSMINLASMPNAGFVGGYLTAPIQGGGYLRQGGFGQTTYTGMPQAGYTGAFANLVNPRPESQADGRPAQVPPVQDPVTGEARCPEGYYFNETLQACIMDTRSTSPFQPTIATAQPMPSGNYYARMGLLDQPPAGLLEAGFGSPQDFAAANTAFRMGAATRPDLYSDPYNLQGYTLLS